MDPNKNARQQVELADKILADEDNNTTEACLLAEMVLALDNWIREGGFLPKQWDKK